MRVFLANVILSTALLFPVIGTAQVYQVRTPVPEVTAVASDWQINAEPIVVQGLVYYPTREQRMFDGQVMMQVDVYDHVPVYADATLEPYSVVYVPVGRGQMRMYERKREGELAGTTGSRTPSFPVGIASSLQREERPVATGGSAIAAAEDRGVASLDTTLPRRTVIETIPRPGASAANGIWIEFDGARWYSDGAAVSYSPERFSPAGDYRGFSVYRGKAIAADEIWVEVVVGGPLAPYRRSK